MFLVAICCAVAFPAFASTPTSGTLSPSNGSSTTWAGSGIGGATTDETTCVDGTDCDVFTITLTGSPSNYQGLVLAINVSHSVTLNDYDFYVHKGDLSGPVVASATAGIPETMESAVIDPTVSGTGVYTVHVVDSTVAPGDPYSGVATITTPPTDSLAHGTAPTYSNYQSPPGLGDSSGEPFGVICTQGTTCPSGTRNLLDFNDVTVDQAGRVFAAYTDGCITAACIAKGNNASGSHTRADNDQATKATIIRQSTGKGLFKSQDSTRLQP